MEIKKLYCDDDVETTIARRKFIEAALELADYWVKTGKTAEQAVDGTLFSLFSMMDGCDSAYDGCSVIGPHGHQISAVLREVYRDMKKEKEGNTAEDQDEMDEQEQGACFARNFELPDGMKFKSCAECNGLHGADKRCLRCNAPIFDDDNYCSKCGIPLEKMPEEADGYCTNCNHELFSGTALNPDVEDYVCPGCHLGNAEGASFKFKSDELRRAYYEARRGISH